MARADAIVTVDTQFMQMNQNPKKIKDNKGKRNITFLHLSKEIHMLQPGSC
jgi:hypothetical protein